MKKVSTSLNGKRNRWVQRKKQRSTHCFDWVVYQWNPWTLDLSSGLLWVKYISLTWLQPWELEPVKNPPLQTRMILWSYRDGTSSQTVEEKSPLWRKGRGLNILQALSRVHVSPQGSQLHSMCWGYKGFLLGTCVYLCVLKSWTRLGDWTTTTTTTKLSHVWHFVIPWTVAFQAPLSMGFSRQECWSGLPCPPPGDLPNPRIKSTSLTSPALADGFFTTTAS